MKARAINTVITLFLSMSLTANAGFRSPIDETSYDAQAIQNTPIHNGTAPVVYKAAPVSVTRTVSSPAPAAASHAPVAAPAQIYGPVFPTQAAQVPAPQPTGFHPAPAKIPSLRLPQEVKNPLAAHAPTPVAPTAKPDFSPKAPSTGVAKREPSPLPTKAPAQKAAQAPAFKAPEAKLPNMKLPATVKNPLASRGPIPKAPALPNTEHMSIPDVQLPNAAPRDGMLPMKPEKLSIRGLNRPQIHAFLKHARELPLPREHELTTTVRSRPIAERYAEALHPTPVKTFRTKYNLALAKVGKIAQPPAATQYENMVKRIDSLFLGLDLSYPKAVMGLSNLAQAPDNAREFQARDALFAGLLSQRAGWDTTTAMMLQEAANKGADREDRYLRILWNQLESVKNPVHLDKIVASVSPLRVRETSPIGDTANYALAKRLMTTHQRAPSAVMPSSDVFAQRIKSKDLRDKLAVLGMIAQLRGPEAKRAEAVAGLRSLEASAGEDNRQAARLALARALLQKGSASEALAFYQNVKKDGKNRLTVLAEQTYAEYLSGAYQDSLGKTVALQTPYFAYGFEPDVHLVEIMTRKAMCDFGGAEEGVKRFADRYAKELNALDQLVAQKKDPAAFYEELVGYADLENPLRFQRYLLQLTGVMENQKAMNQALDELHHLDELGVRQKSIERPEGWDAFTASLRKRWSNRASELRTDSAESALREVSYLAKRLRNTFAQVELLDLDVSTGAAKNYNLQSALNFPAHKQEQAKFDEEKLHWPFETEVWEDEIDYMKAKNPSKCAVTAGL